MAQTSRQVVTRALTFEFPARLPRDLWILPWAEIHYARELKELKQRFPSDFTRPDYSYPPSPRQKGEPNRCGEYTDEWGCVFVNIQDGVQGEVKEPLVADISEWKKVQPPYEQLPENPGKMYAAVSRFYENTDRFVLANSCARPWERYQFLRGTENALMDVMFPQQGFGKLLKVIHDFYLKEIELWAKAQVDGIFFMDDWGTQNQLLIRPELWREYFKPLYRDYCDLAKAYNKFVFMHSDGYIFDIYDDLIEVGVDAINSQLFCMDIEEIGRRFKGRITFWGEIDRQHVLPSKDPQVGRMAVRKLAEHLCDPAGGMIAQFEFGPGANPATAFAVAEEWQRVERELNERNKV